MARTVKNAYTTNTSYKREICGAPRRLFWEGERHLAIKRAMVRYDAPPLHVNASLSRGDIRGVAAAISADRARCEIRRRRLRSFQLIRRKWRMGTALSEPGDTSRELLGRSGVAALIPDIRIGEVEFGFWRNDQFSGHTGRALVALCLATIVPKPGPGKDGLSGAPVLVLATRGRVLPRGWPRGRPRDLPLAGAFLPGSDQKSKFQYRSLHPPSVHSLRYGAPLDAPLENLVEALTWLAGRPVMDRTGLKRMIDYQLEWAPVRNRGSPEPDGKLL